MHQPLFIHLIFTTVLCNSYWFTSPILQIRKLRHSKVSHPRSPRMWQKQDWNYSGLISGPAHIHHVITDPVEEKHSIQNGKAAKVQLAF